MSKGKINGARALVQALEKENVEIIFGYPGGATLPVYDAMAGRPVRHILSRHEQGAAHMADGYARSTGKTGVCMATSGPGATNLVTGIATAYMDSSSVVAITGQVPRTMIGNDAFQEVDITGITVPITKHNYLIGDAREIPGAAHEAFYLASSGRKGPVLIDIPKDTLTEEFSPEQLKEIHLEGYKPTVKGHPGQIKRAVQTLEKAERPVIIAGGGVALAGANDALVRLAEKASIPVVWTLMGKGGFPNTHPLSLGLMGYHGRIAANHAIQHADVILAFGCRFGDRTTGPLSTFAPDAALIHVDIDPAEISKNVPSQIPIVGAIDTVIPLMEERVTSVLEKNRKWLDTLYEIQIQHPLPARREGVTVPSVLDKLASFADDPVIVTDVGRHQIFTAHYLPVDTPRSFITSGGLGTMGFGLPAAIGAKAGNPDRPVYCIAGDGSFMMNCQEIVTAVEENIHVVVLIMNDYCLGMIRQLQDAFYNKNYNACHFDKNCDFALFADSFGATGIRVEEEEQILPALEMADGVSGPVIIDCILDEPENVFPMVTGKSLLDYIEED